jgi:protein-disulfide isomerase
MSRAHNSRQKAKRQEARRVAAEAARRKRKPFPRLRPRQVWPLIPVMGIAGILIATAFVSFGTGSETVDAQVDQEVDTLLADLPQRGSRLGSADAPIRVIVYGDVECPTFKLWVEKYLPSWIDEWIRPGTVNLEYRSLQTDTIDEEIFFAQEMAALAAGQQNRMWNFLLISAREQGKHFTNYADDAFLTGIAEQVPELDLTGWGEDREKPDLSKKVALDIFAAHSSDFRFTPSFALQLRKGGQEAFAKSGFKDSFIRDVESMRGEAERDAPGLSFQRR